jgi:hypothetical protein
MSGRGEERRGRWERAEIGVMLLMRTELGGGEMRLKGELKACVWGDMWKRRQGEERRCLPLGFM